MKRFKKLLSCSGIFLLIILSAVAQEDGSLLKDSGWTYHFQFTSILQGHPTLNSPYTGLNSLQPTAEKAFSVTSTLYLGRKLWKGASLFINPELAGGRGISSTLGIAGFPNGETFRIGDPEPTVYVARVFLRQYINLDKNNYEDIPEDVNQVTEKVSVSRIRLSLGKFGMADFFDGNSLSHDPRTDFMNWALMNNGAFDYAANTRGYTYGFVAELIKPTWALRLASTLEPTFSNGPKLDWHYSRTNSENIELEKKYSFLGRKAVIKLLGYYNLNRAPNYNEAVEQKVNGTDTSLDAIYGKKYGSRKIGLGINVEQEISHGLNCFLRIGWNDGRTATWAFAEIDNTVSAGIRFGGKGWKRIADNIGLAVLSNGISSGHRNFLNAGGYGFMIGDGKLPNYSRENILEIFYESKILRSVWGTLDYQFVEHPAYNRDRGPVHVFAARVHIAW